ncbi:MAG: NTP transferase domain-containing protein, partial [Actinomycetota bacterium]|nr:NTP transferase domain-containing protein [Actinomycetota bacterium]
MTGVIPAAGEARRLQPLPGSKELLTVGGRPVMDHLVERMRAVGAEVTVVTRPDKRDVIEHARRLELNVVVGRPQSVSESILLGVGEGETIVLGFPDTVWEPRDGFAHLLRALDGVDVALGVFESEEPERSDVVILDEDRVAAVDVKPLRPRSSLVWG